MHFFASEVSTGTLPDPPTKMNERNSKNFPFEIHDVDPEQTVELMKYFSEDQIGYVRVGPKGYFLPQKYKKQAADVYNMPLRSSDVFIVTYARSGTTWTQEMVWLLANDLDYDKAAATPIVQRFPFLEFSMLVGPKMEKAVIEENSSNKENSQLLETILKPGAELAAALPSPRYIKTHLPLSLLPPSLLETTKVVYVARDPRDVAVSFYNLYKLFKAHVYTGDFKTYWNYFIKDMINWTPFFDHVKEAWEKRHHPNMLFLFFEDLITDLPGGIRRVAKFLGKQLTEPQVARLSDHLSIDNFKRNASVNDTTYRGLGFFTDWSQPFIRKGKSGGWRDHFDAEMTAQAERWMADNLRDTDLRFPQRGDLLDKQPQ